MQLDEFLLHLELRDFELLTSNCSLSRAHARTNNPTSDFSDKIKFGFVIIADRHRNCLQSLPMRLSDAEMPKKNSFNREVPRVARKKES